METDHLQMRIMYLEKVIEKLQDYIEKLEIKLKGNPFTRDSFKETYANYSWHWFFYYDVSTDITDNWLSSL